MIHTLPLPVTKPALLPILLPLVLADPNDCGSYIHIVAETAMPAKMQHCIQDARSVQSSVKHRILLIVVIHYDSNMVII